MERSTTVRSRLLFTACVAIFLLTPLWTVRRPTVALRLPPDLLDEHADRLARGDWYLGRQAMMMLKTVGGMAWGADPAVRAALGFPAYGPDPGTRRTS